MRLAILCLSFYLFTESSLCGQVITTFAGNNTFGFSGWGGPATSAEMGELYGVAADGLGNVYACDNSFNVIWKVNSAGVISILAGTGVQGYSGDGGPAAAAQLFSPFWIGCDPAGNVYFTDQKGIYIRKVSTAGVITTIAGNPAAHFTGGDGGPLSAASFYSINAIVPDNAGNIYITDNNTIRKVNSAGIIHTIAGTGAMGFSGDGGPATAATMEDPGAVAVDAAGNVYIPDGYNQRIRKVNPAGIITTIAGNGTLGNSGNGGPAVNATFRGPFAVVVDNLGNLYVDDEGNYEIRKIDPAGIITDYAGNGTFGYSGDGGPAVAGQFSPAEGIAIDNLGNIYIADITNYVVRKVSNCLLAQISQQPVAAAVCINGNAAFSVNATNATGYQWQVNTGSGWANLSDGGIYSGSATGNLSISSVTGVMNGYRYQCELTNACAMYPSSAAMLTVNSMAPPAITIASSAATLCAGTPVSFTATPTNGGSAPVYQWLLNGVNTGTNSPAYTDNTPASGDIVSCQVTSNVTCVASPTATSNKIALTVNPLVTPVVSITASAATICAGTAVSFMATESNGGTAPTWQWQVNGVNNGSGNPVFSSSSLANGDVVRCILGSNALCASNPTAVSNPLPVTVNPVVSPGLSIAASATGICAGVPVTFTASPSNGGAAPYYQWKVNGNDAGSNNPVFSSSSLANGDVVSCVMTSDANCAVSPTTSSNNLSITIQSMVTPAVAIAPSSTTICAGTPVSFTATASNGGASPSYEWRLNGADVGGNSPIYTNANLVNGDIIDCILTGDAICAASPTAVSNSVPITVDPLVNAEVTIAVSAVTVCAGTEVTFTASPTNGGASPVYQWRVNGNKAGGDNPTFASSSLANGDMVSCMLTSSLSCSASVQADNPIVMTVNPVPAVTLMADTIIAYGQSVILKESVGLAGGGSVAAYTWVPATGLNDPAAANPVATPDYSTTYQLTVVSNEGCAANGKVAIGVFRSFHMPNAFTPNGDGKNDVYRVPPSEGVKIVGFAIYNRWGARVFMTTNSSAGWDGTVNGVLQPAGVYVWTIEYKDVLTGKRVTQNGTMILVR